MVFLVNDLHVGMVPAIALSTFAFRLLFLPLNAYSVSSAERPHDQAEAAPA